MRSFVSKLFFTITASLYALPALAALNADDGAKASQPDKTPTDLFGGSHAVFNNIANILIFLAGAIAVLVLIFGGIRYVISTGDAGRVKQAKDTILYGLIGVVIAVLAYAIVHFVVGNLTKGV